ncbi:DegV family protein [Paradesulfitobacterium ferrireducens]|uniref:DegV family protein n=1 Tax=Paradesulfitobacterium ferrireducens TaxID=2816476 RepID=UPI001A905501|nr:DegV family protein [Paradesulfitobacterium ferrireducens]
MPYTVVVDSSADIPPKYADRVLIVPMPVTIDDKTYLEGIDLFPENFYPLFSSLQILPKTSQPNLKDLLDRYEQALKGGNEVVAIHLSSGLSSTVSSAFLARDMCSQPDRVHVIDSLGASFGYGLLALQVAAEINSYHSWEDAERFILEKIQRMRYVFTLDTLDYLVKGGRVSKTAGFIGGLLDIKPILHITPDGKIEPFAKVRSRRAAIRKLVEIMEQEVKDSEPEIIAISHSNCPEDALTLEEEIRSRIPVKDVWVSQIGCIIGSHTGPGTVALFYPVSKRV